jgi:primase-polymerase (primpol)-like protein
LLQCDKTPHYVTGRKRSGTLDSPADLAKLATYTAAVEALTNRPGWGLGFAINRGYQFIDLDDVADKHGVLVPPVVVTAAIKLGAWRCPQRHRRHITGYHPSGESFPTNTKKPAERYTHGRYMALGRQVLNTAPTPCPDTALSCLQPRPEEARPRLVTDTRPRAHRRVLERPSWYWQC